MVHIIERKEISGSVSSPGSVEPSHVPKPRRNQPSGNGVHPDIEGIMRTARETGIYQVYPGHIWYQFPKDFQKEAIISKRPKNSTYGGSSSYRQSRRDQFQTGHNQNHHQNNQSHNPKASGDHHHHQKKQKYPRRYVDNGEELSDDAFTDPYELDEWRQLPKVIKNEIERQRFIKRARQAAAEASKLSTTL